MTKPKAAEPHGRALMADDLAGFGQRPLSTEVQRIVPADGEHVRHASSVAMPFGPTRSRLMVVKREKSFEEK